MILAADIGGTHTRLLLAELTLQGWDSVRQQDFASGDFLTNTAVIQMLPYYPMQANFWFPGLATQPPPGQAITPANPPTSGFTPSPQVERISRNSHPFQSCPPNQCSNEFRNTAGLKDPVLGDPDRRCDSSFITDSKVVEVTPTLSAHLRRGGQRFP